MCVAREHLDDLACMYDLKATNFCIFLSATLLDLKALSCFCNGFKTPGYAA
jgi:hypothetical protein